MLRSIELSDAERQAKEDAENKAAVARGEAAGKAGAKTGEEEKKDAAHIAATLKFAEEKRKGKGTADVFTIKQRNLERRKNIQKLLYKICQK